MTQLVRGVDIENDLIGWLPGAMATLGRTVTVSDQIGAVNSMAVYRTGGTMRDLVTDAPTIVVEAYGRTKTSSCDMLLDARALIFSLAGREVNDHAVQRVQEFSGPAHLPIANALTRYTMTLSLDVSADVIG